MKKIIILSYYFPPCNLTPSERIYSWARFLKKGGYYPIIITRNWDIPVKNPTTDVYLASGKEIKIEKFEDYEVHYLTYEPSIKEKLFIRLYKTKLYFIYLGFAFIYSIFQLFFLKLFSFYKSYYYVKNLIKKEPSINILIVSVSPFELLGIAYKLCKKLKIKWIADYRDDWSTNELGVNPFPKNIFRKINRRNEKKWLSNATTFLSVSEYYVKKISNLINLKGHLLSNGYIKENYYGIPASLFEKFTITYVGSIYPAQQIELFLQGVKSFISKQNPNININFIGIKNDIGVVKRIENCMIGFEKYISFTERMPKQEAIAIQNSSHLLLACSYSNLRGIPGSKLYEYIALRKKVIVYPTDNDVIEKTLLETKQGVICKSEDDLLNALSYYYNEYMKNTFLQSTEVDQSVIEKYSRENQTSILINVLDKML